MSPNAQNLVRFRTALLETRMYKLADKVDESGRDLHDLTVRELLALIDEVDK